MAKTGKYELVKIRDPRSGLIITRFKDTKTGKIYNQRPIFDQTNKMQRGRAGLGITKELIEAQKTNRQSLSPLFNLNNTNIGVGRNLKKQISDTQIPRPPGVSNIPPTVKSTGESTKAYELRLRKEQGGYIPPDPSVKSDSGFTNSASGGPAWTGVPASRFQTNTDLGIKSEPSTWGGESGVWDPAKQPADPNISFADAAQSGYNPSSTGDFKSDQNIGGGPTKAEQAANRTKQETIKDLKILSSAAGGKNSIAINKAKLRLSQRGYDVNVNQSGFRNQLKALTGE